MVSTLKAKLGDIERRLRAVERPSGTQIAQLVQQVQDELANIDATVAASIAAHSYTAATIDAKDAATRSAAAGDAESWVNGGQTIAGGWSASDLYTRNGPGFNITATRVAAWLQSADGRVGTATSSLQYKENIESAAMVERAQAILGIQIKHYNYINEIRKRDDPTFEEYVGPSYHVHQEVGMIAEELHAAGLWEFVIYQRDPVYETRQDENGDDVQVIVGDTLHLDEDGNPVPDAIHYELFGMAALAAAQYLFGLIQTMQDQIDTLTGDVAAIKAHVGM
jgi:hypothetical protein